MISPSASESEKKPSRAQRAAEGLSKPTPVALTWPSPDVSDILEQGRRIEFSTPALYFGGALFLFPGILLRTRTSNCCLNCIAPGLTIPSKTC